MSERERRLHKSNIRKNFQIKKFKIGKELTIKNTNSTSTNKKQSEFKDSSDYKHKKSVNDECEDSNFSENSKNEKIVK